MKVYSPHIDPPKFDFNTWREDEESYTAEAVAWVKENSTPHPLNGEIVALPFADGAAYYIIGKINGKVSLVHLPIGDAWRHHMFERTATVKELKLQVNQAKARAARFSGV